MTNRWEIVQSLGIAKYDFTPNGEHQLPLKRGQKVKVLKKRSGWYKGTAIVNGVEKKGIFPENFIDLYVGDNDGQLATSPVSTFKKKRGKVLYDFTADGKHQLSVKKDDIVVVLASSKGWYKGYVVGAKPEVKGYFPETFVTLDDETEPQHAPEAPAPLENDEDIISNMTMQALLKEIQISMDLWLDEANDALSEGKITDYQRVQERITTLLELRTQLTEIPPEDMKMDFPPLRKHIIQLIEKSRKMVVGFMVPRNAKGMLAETKNTSVVELLRLHREMYQPGDDVAHFSFSNHKLSTMRRRSSVIRINKSLNKNLHSATEMINSALGRKPESDRFQLILECSMVITTIKEDFHLSFSLWNKKKLKPITEEWSLTFSSLGMARDVLKNKTVFADITLEDLEDDLWLVCKVYRYGVLLLDKAPTTMAAAAKSGDTKYRRPFFVSMASLQSLGFRNFVEKMYSPGRELSIRAPPTEMLFTSMPKLTLENKIPDAKEVLEAKQVVLNLSLQNGSLEQTLKRDDGALEGVTISRKLYFPPVFNPDKERNNLFLWISTGKFDQGSKKAPINAFIVVKAFADGKLIEKAIRGCGNPDPQDQYVTSVYYHTNTPPWDEILSLKIKPSLLEKVHLQFIVYHASTNKKYATPLSFGWLNLTTEKGSVIPDKGHKIPTYKISSSLKETKMCKYLHIGGKKNLKPRGKGEEIHVKTLLLSTVKTQSLMLYPLLNWEDYSVQQIEHYLKQFVNNPYSSEQTKRYVKVLMGLLFSMIEKQSHRSIHMLILRALVHVFSEMGEEESKMMEMYLKNVFKFTRSHTVLLDLCTSSFEAERKHVSSGLVPLTKSLHWLMQFAVRSFELNEEKAKYPLADFKTSLKKLMGLVSNLLSMDVDDQKWVAQCQANTLKYFPIIAESMDRIFSGDELSILVVGIIKAINPYHTNDVARLNLIRVLTKSMAFRETARATFFPLLLEIFTKYLLPREESVDECFITTAVLRTLIGFIECTDNKETEHRELRDPKDAAEILLQFTPMLEVLIRSTLLLLRAKANPALLPKPTPSVVELIQSDGKTLAIDSLVCTITVLKLLPPKMLLDYLQSLEERSRFIFLVNLLKLFSLVLKVNPFSEVWVIFVTLQVQVICKVHSIFGPVLCETARKQATLTDTQEEAISLFFTLGLDLLQHKDLKTEDMNERRKRLVLAQLKEDLRPEIRKSFTMLWEALGNQRPMFTRALIPGMFGIISTRLTSDGRTIEGKLRPSEKMCMDVFYSMIVTEYHATKKLNKVERYTIEGLSQIIHDSQGRGEAFYKMLDKDLRERFKEDPENEKAPGLVFLGHVSHLFGLMASLLKFPTTAIYEDERNRMALALMEYLSKPDENGNIRREMYFRYVQYLVDLHAEIKNYQEAGITQLLEVDMLEWSDDIVEARGEFPREMERERKERLYQNANSFFTSGQDWERAITMCEKLAQYYRNDAYDYEKLADVLKQEAELFRKIANAPRFYPSYYRVLFKGEFPEEKDGNEYVYRGGRMEKVMNFSQRIKRKYPSAKLVMRWNPKESDLKDNKQVIAIVTLKLPACKTVISNGLATAKMEREVKALHSNSRVTKEVVEYYENNSRSVFLYEKPEQRSKDKKPANEFKELWVRQHFLVTETEFPTVKRRSKVEARKEIMLSPIENAACMVHEKNQHISKEIQEVHKAAKLTDSSGKQSLSSSNKLPKVELKEHKHGGSKGSSTLATPRKIDRTSKLMRVKLERNSKLNQSAKSQTKVPVNKLSQALAGTIDAAVNGGTKLFCEAFLTPAYRKEHKLPEDLEKIRTLRRRLKEQVAILRDGLSLFKSVCPTEYVPLLQHLLATYAKMEASIQRYYEFQ